MRNGIYFITPFITAVDWASCFFVAAGAKAKDFLENTNSSQVQVSEVKVDRAMRVYYMIYVCAVDIKG